MGFLSLETNPASLLCGSSLFSVSIEVIIPSATFFKVVVCLFVNSLFSVASNSFMKLWRASMLLHHVIVETLVTRWISYLSLEQSQHFSINSILYKETYYDNQNITVCISKPSGFAYYTSLNTLER